MRRDKKKESITDKIDHKLQEKEKEYLVNRAAMCDEQNSIMEEIRKGYLLSGKPNDKEALSSVERALGMIGISINRSYLPYVKDCYVPSYNVDTSFNPENRIAHFDISRWVTDKEEKNIDKLLNVYQVLANEDCNIALIYERKEKTCKATIAVVNNGEKDSTPKIAKDLSERLQSAVKGNFPGAEVKKAVVGVPDCLNKVVQYEVNSKSVDGVEKKDVIVKKAHSVAIVNNLPSDKSEDFLSQSMEKLLDGIVPQKEEEDYILILLASPSRRVDEEKSKLYEAYNALAPYASWQENVSTQDNTTLSAGSSLTKSVGAQIGASVGFDFGANVMADIGLSASISASLNFGASFGKTAGYSAMVGKSEGVTTTCTNYAVKHTLELLEEQTKRLEECSALGMWEFAAYAISETPTIANNVATMYYALTQGEKSYLSQSAINEWHGKNQKDEAACILQSLRRLNHPHFFLRPDLCEKRPEFSLFPGDVNLYSLISGKELARALNFPRKSVAGLAVIECSAFGREVQKFSIKRLPKDELTRKEKRRTGDKIENDQEENQIEVGNIVHMYKEEVPKVKLDLDSFTSHVFVTGSTGAGKSNTIYQLLSKAKENSKKVLVIEPAKGEYKTALGDDYQLYGTNPSLSEMLRINPFSFPVGNTVKKPIHVLEHIDRLVEILNACWPMYAAMPAVLKDAVEMAYQNKGWDLYSNKCQPLEFPTFADLLETLPEVMSSSLYSKDTQSDYAGALVTRVKSLTNGINGLVFCSDNELPDDKLFNENVIVDLSRIGSNETKAMLMGIMIMKLQEFHMSNSGVNEKLQHITVLEEAHHLLRRTASAQGQETGNLQGKSVEMLSNSIAEMRTYGEGFIIADQAPGLLDESVIRNTNTKIILRLPDSEDRNLVGKAAALTDNQIDELAKLPRGVAVIYQNDWVEAVLCQFEKYTAKSTNETRILDDYEIPKPKESYFEVLFNMSDNDEVVTEDVDTISNWISKLAYPSLTKAFLRKALMKEKLSPPEMRSVAYNLFDGKRLAKNLNESIDTNAGISDMDERIKGKYGFENDALVTEIRQLILQYVSECMKTDAFENRYIEFMGRRKF